MRRTSWLTLAVFVAAGCSGADGNAPSTHDKPAPPQITRLSVTPATIAEPGTVLDILYAVLDTAGVTRTRIVLSGSASRQLDFTESGERSLTLFRQLQIPANAQPGVPLRVSVIAYGTEGLRDSVSAPDLQVVDASAPVLHGGAQTSNGYDADQESQITKGVGDVLRISVRATDNHQLAWVGYRLGAPANRADSTAVSDSAASMQAAIEVPQSWVGESSIMIFARDAAGHLTELTPPGASFIPVFPVRSTEVQTLPLGYTPMDQAYDMSSGMLYLLASDSVHVVVVSTASFTLAAPIVLAEPAGGLDIDPSGDSLLLTLPHSGALGMLPLAAAGGPMRRIALDTAGAHFPDKAKFTANGKVLVSMPTVNAVDAAYRFTDVDVTTGTGHPRTDAAIGPGGGTTLTPSWNREWIMAVVGGGCCYGSAIAYNSTRDGFTTTPALASLGTGEPTTADSLGDGFLFGHRYVWPDLFTSRAIDPPNYSDFYYVPTAISPDGRLGYFANAEGYTSVRMADGTVIERVKALLPASSDGLGSAYRMIALPNGTKLIGWTWNANILFEVDRR